MKCPNHPEKDVLSFCHSCGEYLCRECLVDGKEYYYCKKEECQKAKMNELNSDKNVEIGQYVSTQNDYAGFWKRVAAFLIDYFLLVIPSIIILVLARIIFTGGSYNDLGIIERLFVALVFWLYFSIMESSKLQGTIGKLVLKIKVTDLNGERIGFGKATGRHFGKILSGFVIGIGFAMAGFTNRKQCLHDMLAGSLVIKRYPTSTNRNRQTNFLSS
jgi:uncharacterized RDD family membrane protein YckC